MHVTPRYIRASTPLDRNLLDTGAFSRAIAIERRRVDRSKKLFVLMLVDLGPLGREDQSSKRIQTVLGGVSSSIRETDVIGWHCTGVLGIIFTEIDAAVRNSVVSTLVQRVQGVLYEMLSFVDYSRVSIATYTYPEEWDGEVPHRPSSPVLYPDLDDHRRKAFLVIKRMVDILGSLLGLVIVAPVVCTIAIAIKVSSEGPILFRQQRIGQYGVPFTFFKFRSMYVNCDPAIHQNYVEALIHGKPDANQGMKTTYKLTGDLRVTPIGAFLRKSSLDELPQLYNVLKGEMSLVGPRPAIPYEVQAYEPWHRRRVLEAKPGITGFWQVRGRSRVSFDEMVRMDVQYAAARSIWLDLQILASTPRAVFSGQGAV
jgi:lipopolysaccharide/colanic/teichoic acid biosynthesis glycosyltransferase